MLQMLVGAGPPRGPGEASDNQDENARLGGCLRQRRMEERNGASVRA